MDKLKPCPFCGGLPMVGNNRAEMFIECMSCEARPWTLDFTIGIAHRERLSDWWNHRADKPRESDDNQG